MKDKFFIFLTLVLTSAILFFTFYAYGTYAIKSEFKSNFNNKDQFLFYKRYSKIVNHLRFSEKYQNFNSNKENQLFTIINENKNKNIILFQGDSWFQQIEKLENKKKFFSEYLTQNYAIINAGTTSYSPSLMHAQYKILTKDFIKKPEILIIYIDQTDIGDEICRYKNLVIKKNNILESVTYEEFPLYKDPFNLHEILSFSEIDFNYKNKVTKIYYYYKYKIQKAFFKNLKKIKFELGFANYEKCYGEKIYSYLYNLSDNNKNYFENIIKEFFEILNNDKEIKKIYIVSHPHKIHINMNKKTIDVSDLLPNLISTYPKFKHINFSKIIDENKNFYKNIKEIWSEDQMHLDDKNFSIFFKKIVSIIEEDLIE